MTVLLAREYVKLVVPIVSGATSLVCSILLIGRLLKVYRKNAANGRDDIIFGLSLFDAISSIGFAGSQLPCPSGVQMFCLGNVQTCDAQAFLLQLSSSIPLYYSGLSLYFLLSVRFRVQISKLRSYMIPIVHCIAVSVSVGSAIAGLVLKLYSFDYAFCWFQGHTEKLEEQCHYAPELCGRNNTHAAELAQVFIKLFALLPAMFAIIVTCISMIILYCRARKLEARNHRHEFTMQSSQSQTIHRRLSLSFTDPRPRGAKRVSTEVIERGTLYVLVLWLCFLPTTYLVVLRPLLFPERWTDTTDPAEGWIVYTTFELLSGFFAPFHGALNFLVYTRAEWCPRVRRAYLSYRCWCRQAHSGLCLRQGDAEDDPIEDDTSSTDQRLCHERVSQQYDSDTIGP